MSERDEPQSVSAEEETRSGKKPAVFVKKVFVSPCGAARRSHSTVSPQRLKRRIVDAWDAAPPPCSGSTGTACLDNSLPAKIVLYLPKKHPKSRAPELYAVGKVACERENAESVPFQGSCASGQARHEPEEKNDDG